MFQRFCNSVSPQDISGKLPVLLQQRFQPHSWPYGSEVTDIEMNSKTAMRKRSAVTDCFGGKRRIDDYRAGVHESPGYEIERFVVDPLGHANIVGIDL